MEDRETGSLNIDHTNYITRLSRSFSGRKPYTPSVPGRIYSFIPGTIVEVLVSKGDMVSEGDDVVILDAMKMKNRLKSHVEGKVISVSVRPGDKVAKGSLLVEIA
jgi:biotin carboxyl carrier protein